MQHEDYLLRVKQIVPHIIPISKSQWWIGVRKGKYPKPIKLGSRTTCWRKSDIMKIIEQGVNNEKTQSQ